MGTKNSAQDIESDLKREARDAVLTSSRARGRERKEVKTLIERGRLQGYLTYDEVNDAVPVEMVTSDQIDNLMSWLAEEEIQVVDSAASVKRRPDGQVKPARTKKEERANSLPPSVVDDSYSNKSNDPVRMYLRKMGAVSRECIAGRWAPYRSARARARSRAPSASKTARIASFSVFCARAPESQRSSRSERASKRARSASRISSRITIRPRSR